MGTSVRGATGGERDWATWAVEHKRTLLYAAGAVVLLVVVAWLYVVSEQRKERFASQALAAARSDAAAGNLPLAESDLTRLIDRYSGAQAADEGEVLLNDIRLVQGGPEVATAVADLQSFVKSGHPAYIQAGAWRLLAGGYEQEGKFADASKAYAEAVREAPHDFLKAEYLLDEGRTAALAGDSTAARAAYAEVLEKYGKLNQAAEARVRLGELGGAPPAAKSGAHSG